MPSRRRFLQTAGIAAGTGLAATSFLGATEEGQPVSLPTSIAELKSLRHQAVPISPEERVARLENARRFMAANKLDAILLMESTSLNYFTGMRWWGGERLFAMVLPAKAAPFFVCPAFEEGRAREQISKAPVGEPLDVRIWQEDESPYEKVAQGFRDQGLATGQRGIEETVRIVFFDWISKAA